MKAAVAAFNQKKALVGAFSVITNLRMELFEALVDGQWRHLFTLNEVSLVLLTGRSWMSRVEDILW